VSENYDLIVIGTGGAAFAAGIEARERGKSVLLVERNVLGGTCLNVGCVPSKRLLAASGHRHSAATDPFPAAPTSAGPVDLPALITQKQNLIDALRDAKYQAVADAHGFRSATARPPSPAPTPWTSTARSSPPRRSSSRPDRAPLAGTCPASTPSSS